MLLTLHQNQRVNVNLAIVETKFFIVNFINYNTPKEESEIVFFKLGDLMES